MRKLQLVVAVTVALSAVITAVPRLTFDRAGWLADLEALEAHLSRAYANLEDAPRRGVDLAALDRTAREALRRASTDRQARAALAAFLEAFHDPHLLLPREKLSKKLARLWRSFTSGEAGAADPALAPALSGAEACAIVGAAPPRRPDLGFDLAGTPGFRPLAGQSDLAAGTLEVAGRLVGLVRIPSFSANHFPLTCARAWESHRTTLSGPCQGDCLERFSREVLETAVLAELAARVRALAAEGATALVVDVTGNGGGNSWADAAARVVTAGPLDCPATGFVRHPHWAEHFEAQLGELEEEARRPDLTASEAALLERARARVAALRDEARRTCDTAGLWRGELPGCRQRVEPEGRTCGLLGPLPHGAVRDPRSWSVLDSLWQYTYDAGAWSGPLAVLIDGRTASASEAFAATLRDGGAARLVGQRTLGAGCGYTNGGIPLRLPHSGLEVKAPDCSRLRKDGTNEIDGLQPDHPAAAPTAEAALAALTGWVGADVARAR